MKPYLSIVIPAYNAARTIGACLESIFAVADDGREVVVVDDCSEDGTADIVETYPCRLVRLEKRKGASAARNAGAFSSSGEALFFIDADCLLEKGTLSVIRTRLSGQPADVVVGGTYTPLPYDPGFFSLFQSIFINYFETKNADNPDYLATHALLIRANVFKELGGFAEEFFPILEDVEFSHRMRSAGYLLLMDPALRVRHSFNYSLARSLRNAYKKTRWWIAYSLSHRDLFADSGAASHELKVTGVIWLTTFLLVLLVLSTGQRGFLALLPLLWTICLWVNRYLFKTFFNVGGAPFALKAGVYYTMVYPAAVWSGAFRGIAQWLTGSLKRTGRVPNRRGSAGPKKDAM